MKKLKLTVRSLKSSKARGYWWIDNCAIDDYATLLPAETFRIYCLYARRVMQHSQSTVLELGKIAKHFHVGHSTVSKSLKILEWCGMLHVVWQGKRRSPRVYLPEIMPLTDKTIASIRERIEAVSGYETERKSLLQRLDSFMSLGDRIATDIASVEAIPSELVFSSTSNGSNGVGPKSIYDKAWSCCLSELENSMTKATFHKLFQGSMVEYDEGSRALTVLVEREDAKQWLEQKHIGRIQTIADMFFETGVSEVRVRMKA